MTSADIQTLLFLRGTPADGGVYCLRSTAVGLVPGMYYRRAGKLYRFDEPHSVAIPEPCVSSYDPAYPTIHRLLKKVSLSRILFLHSERGVCITVLTEADE